MKMIKTLLALTLLSVALPAQVNIKGATVDATQGYTVNGGAPNNWILCGNGTKAVFSASCGTVANPFYQTIQINGVSLPAQRFILNFDSNFTGNDSSPSSTIHLATTISSNTTGNAATATTAANSNAVGGVPLGGLCQSSGTGCSAYGFTGSLTSPNGYIQFPNGLIMQWAQGTLEPSNGQTFQTVNYPIACPTQVLSATVSTNWSTSANDDIMMWALNLSGGGAGLSSAAVVRMRRGDDSTVTIQPVVFIICN